MMQNVCSLSALTAVSFHLEVIVHPLKMMFDQVKINNQRKVPGGRSALNLNGSQLKPFTKFWPNF